MTAVSLQADRPAGESAPAPTRTGRALAFGTSNVAVICILSLASWYLLIDPDLSPLDTYPEPFTALLFWGLIAIVWMGFNQEFALFTRLAQPLRGIVITAGAVAVAGVITWVLAAGWGRIDETFASTRDGGTGYFSGALWVLFAFIMCVMSVVNWQHWPMSLTGLTQPWLGAAQVFVIAVPTPAHYAVFGLPSVAAWANPDHVLMNVNTVIGMFYGILLSVVVTGLLTENWPWRLAGRPTAVAITSLVGNTVVGIGIYFGLRQLTVVMIGSANADALGAALSSLPAQIGVCWVFWMIVWANCFNNIPTLRSTAGTYVARIAITFGLAIATFYLYYFVVAEKVLHEPDVTASMAGNALGWMDWMVLWTLIYVLCFESYGLGKLRPTTDLI